MHALGHHAAALSTFKWLTQRNGLHLGLQQGHVARLARWHGFADIHLHGLARSGFVAVVAVVAL
jgi:hypothetical protein